MEGSGNNLVLLLLCELNEVYRITAYAYGELGISLGVSLSVKESLTAENVYVKVVSTLLYVAVKERNKIIYLILCCCHYSYPFVLLL